MNVDYVKLMAANEVLRSGEVNYKALKYVTDYLEALAQIIPAEARKFEANQAIFAVPYLKENPGSIVARDAICPFIDSVITKSGKIDPATLTIQVKDEEGK